MIPIMLLASYFRTKSILINKVHKETWRADIGMILKVYAYDGIKRLGSSAFRPIESLYILIFSCSAISKSDSGRVDSAPRKGVRWITSSFSALEDLGEVGIGSFLVLGIIKGLIFDSYIKTKSLCEAFHFVYSSRTRLIAYRMQ
jgi:hypothetical protein